MLDINPINKNVETQNQMVQNQANTNAGEDQGASVKVVENDKKPIKTIGSDFMSKANTAPEPEFLESKGISKIVFYFVLVSLFLVLALSGYLYFLKKTKGEELKTKEKIQADLEAKIAAPELVNVDALASRYSLGIDEISSLINKPITYSILFDQMEKIIPNEVALSSFDIDEKQNYKISAKGPDLVSTSKFVKSLEKSSFFETVFLTNDQLSSTEDETTYNVSVQGVVDKTLLIPKKDNSSDETGEKE